MLRDRAVRLAGAALATTLALSLAACSGDDPDASPGSGATDGATSSTDEPAPDTPTVPPGEQVELTFGVFGTEAEVAAYQDVVDAYNAQATSVEVTLRSWPTRGRLLKALEGPAEQRPDVYLLNRRDLGRVVDDGVNRSLFGLLQARDISYGDGFSQRSIAAFSAQDDLQCIPYGVSPMVMYYNTDLVDFADMRERGLPAPDEELDSWDWQEMAAAVRYAVRKHPRARGISISPDLESLAPFLYAGGGQVFEGDPPTSLNFSDGTNVDTLAQVLPLLRNPNLTLSDDQLAKADPVTWFERGRLAMVEGYRSLTPRLREVRGLHFDVLPMPRLDTDATVGEQEGLCVSPGPKVQPAADFLVYAISDEGMSTIAETGYVVPASLGVARSESFLQPDQQPMHAGVFNAAVDDIQLLPIAPRLKRAEALVADDLDLLLHAPVIGDLQSVTERIDETSRSVLDPEYVPEDESTDGASPTDDASPSDGETSSDG